MSLSVQEPHMAKPLEKLKVESILDVVFERLDRDLWLKGVQVYRTSKMTHVSCEGGLISVTVKDIKAPKGAWVTRFKLLPNRRMVQWFECGCLDSRKFGGLCEHMIGVLIYIVREKPTFFADLDLHRPFAMAQITPNRRRRKPSKTTGVTDFSLKERKTDDRGAAPERTSPLNPMMDLMDQGEITGLTFRPDAGRLTIQFEIKRAVKDDYELGVDESARFLKDECYEPICKKFLPELKILPFRAYLGWKVVTDPDNEIWEVRKTMLFVTEKVKHRKGGKKSKAPEVEKKEKEEKSLGEQLSEALEITREESECLWTKGHKEEGFSGGMLLGNYEVYALSWGEVEKRCGREYVYLPGLGYCRYEHRSSSSSWQKSSHSAYYRGKEIDRLIATEFRSLRSDFPTLVSKTWLKKAIVEANIKRIDISEYDGHWFSMDPKYEAQGRMASMTKLLMLAKDKNREYISVNKLWVKVPKMMLDLNFHIDEKKQVLKLDTLALLRWRSLWGSLDELWHGREELLEDLKERMSFHDTEGEDLSLDHTNLNLRDYQVEGFKWLWWLYRNHLHGLFADDMGLGKTHQTMALLSMVAKKEKSFSKDSQRFLVICPTTVVGHWMEKIEEFTPILKPLRYHGGGREMIPGYTTLVTSYGVLLRDIEHLGDRTWDVVVCDEAHMIKNPKTSTYWAVKRLKARMRLCLSGTPIENRLWELKTLYDFLVPGKLLRQRSVF